MNFYKEIAQASKIAILFVIFTGIFSFLGKLNILIGHSSIKIDVFLNRYILWIVVLISIIVVLGLYIRKVEGEFNLLFLRNSFIRLSAGFLIVLEGLINLSSLLPFIIASIKSAFEISPSMVENGSEIVQSTIVSGSLQIFTLILQIFFGLYFLFTSKRYQNKEGS